MNQEQPNNNINSNQNQPQPPQQQIPNTLAGSPGVVIAPISGIPADASSANKGRVLANRQSPTATPPTTTIPQPSKIEQNTQNLPPVDPPQPAPKKKSHKAGFFIFLLLLIIGGMGYYIYRDYQQDLQREECSPLVKSDNTLRQLDINSSIVQELYDKVKTTIREDFAYHNFDDTFKLYLAYRQIPQSDIYSSNCNLFNEGAMSNFTCSSANNFTPQAFKEETLEREVKKLFGENIKIPHQNIILGNSCFGGFQYIAQRGEYVQGYCGQVPTTNYNVDKELISATVQGDTITIKEKVRYYSAEGIDNDQLKNGIYVHTFKLDNNYHYAYINRTIEDA
ncbi:MAG TPA: hypothetical protein IAB35_03750 [Candidatus Faecimonas gallistercoris]|nr:hypothetical protein [Candidatus Faecimonas gallistercoris]